MADMLAIVKRTVFDKLAGTKEVGDVLAWQRYDSAAPRLSGPLLLDELRHGAPLPVSRRRTITAVSGHGGLAHPGRFPPCSYNEASWRIWVAGS